jgi:hypothetical protein
MLETNWALHIAANIRCRNGDHADAGEPPPLLAATASGWLGIVNSVLLLRYAGRRSTPW